jgi:putative acetyltransferase
MADAIGIRAETLKDRAAIHSVHAAAFNTDAEARLVDSLRQAQQLMVSLVAEVNEKVVGHIAFSGVKTAAAPDAFGLGLAPLAVLPTHQRRGIGSQLVQQGLAACRASGCGFIVVLGDPNYYSRFGFAPAGRWNLTCEFGGGEAFQAVELRDGAMPTCGGLVAYAPEFALVS